MDSIFYKNNSALHKILLLSHGVKLDLKILEKLRNSPAIEENRYYYNISNDHYLCKKYKIPSEILLPDDVESSFYINEDSPLEILEQNGEFELLLNGKAVSPVDFNFKPLFFEKLLPNGEPCKKYASMYGRYILALFLSGYCQYIQKGQPCKFCSLGYSRNGPGKENAFNIPAGILQDFLKTLELDDFSRIKYVMYTAGTYPELRNGIKLQAELIKTATRYLPNTDFSHHLTTMPPAELEDLRLLKMAGLNSIAFDLEVFNEDLFNFYCPGKKRFYGRDKMISAVETGVEIFGHSNVKVGFVGGLEPLNSLIAGMKYFGSKGASIAVNVFHPDPFTELEFAARPTPVYLLKMAIAQNEIYKNHNLIPVFPVGGRRSSLDTEIYRGFFDNL